MRAGAAGWTRRRTALVAGGAAVILLGAGGTAVALTAATGHGKPKSPTKGASTAGSHHTLLAPAAREQVVTGPKVAKLGKLTESDLIVRATAPLPKATLDKIRHLHDVTAIEVVDAGRASVGGHKANVLGVDPSSFRAWTPKLTARSNALWTSIASGDLAASFDMGRDARLPLGGTIAVGATRLAPTRVGAFVSVGIGSVDAVVSRQVASQIGIQHGNAVVISAPKANPDKLKGLLAKALPKSANIELLRRVITLTSYAAARKAQPLQGTLIERLMQAAKSRLGAPYVWGATGPNSFDCSGFTGWVFAQVGITLPRVSQQQWFAGVHVPLSAAQPGDLLFWHYDPTDPSNIDHVALYAGNGMMYVAPHTGDVVKYTAVPTADLAGVVRVTPADASSVGGPTQG